MAKRILKFGILGCGMIAGFHAEALKMQKDAVLVGAADAVPANASAFAARYGIGAYENFSHMLEDKSIDAVCICTPSGYHAENAIAALNAHKHVALEKPMATTSEDAVRIRDAAERNDRVLTVISQLRFSDDIQKAKKLISENALGRLLICDLYMKYWRDESYYSGSNWKGTLKFDGGGALMNQGIHGVDLLLYLAGNAKVQSSVTKTAYHSIETEDVALAILDFENGASGVLEASTCAYPGFERRIELHGSNGCIILKENEIEKLVIGGETLKDGASEKAMGTSADPSAMESRLHFLQLSNFIGAVNGTEKLLIDAHEGQKAVNLIENVYNLAEMSTASAGGGASD